MAFLHKLWQSLKEKIGQGENAQNIRLNKIQGYRSIHIQKLQNKKHPPSYIKKIWGTQNNQYYMENTQLTNHKSQGNGLFWAFLDAYKNHGDVKIKPDDIWHTILLWFTKYVDDNQQQLAQAFVHHQGKKKLQVLLPTVCQQKKWQMFLNQIIIQIQKNTIEGTVDKLKSNFSTSTLFDKVFSTAIIMNTFKHYFDYSLGMCACGIQNIHMGGKLEDWQNLVKKLQGLIVYDVNGNLKRYIKGLKPVLQQFVQTYKGKANIQFWNNIYEQRQNPHYGPYQPKSYYYGWLFKFITQYDTIQDQVIQVGKISVPINYKNYQTGEERKYRLEGGCKGYSVDQNNIYTPHFGLAIYEQNQYSNLLDMMKLLSKHKY